MKTPFSKQAVMRFLRLVKTPVLIGVALGLLVGIVIVINNQANSQREAREESTRHQLQMQLILKEIQKSIAEDKKNTKETNDHIECIIKYFQRPVRTGLYIDRVKECRLKRRAEEVSQISPAQNVALAPPATPPRTEDRSFLDCLPAEVRRKLNKTLPKDHVLRTMHCNR